MARDNSNSKKSTKADAVNQPLMSTGTTEPSFDWVSNETNSTAKPKIGNTVMEEKEDSDSSEH